MSLRYTPYEFLNYTTMRQKLYNLESSYKNFISITTASKKFNISHEVYCGYTKCELDIVTLTD